MSSGGYCDLSGFKFLTFSQKNEYQRAWQIFNNVQSFNSNVSTLRFQGFSNLTYYQFISGEEKTKFTQGRFLHVQAYPNSNWPLVEEN
jgi:hypothetical protein